MQLVGRMWQQVRQDKDVGVNLRSVPEAAAFIYLVNRAEMSGAE